MKRLILTFCFLALVLSTVQGGGSDITSTDQSRAETIAAELFNPHSGKVLVVAHRGDWRGWPENSLQAMESAIKMGVDIIEIDLRMTADSILVICHDATLDRTTSGHGMVSEQTYDYIRNCRLKTGHGVVTEYIMPTLTEALELCRGRVMILVDKGYEYYDMVLKETERLGMTGQVIMKVDGRSVDSVKANFAQYSVNMPYMPNINVSGKGGRDIFGMYQERNEVPPVYEIGFTKIDPWLEECAATIAETGSKLMVSTLWPSVCGGLYDDVACLGDPDQVYGRFIDLGTRIFQTDRPAFLLDYLRSKGLHD